jgi:two-component system chemotaxis response regulator CheB
VPARRIRAPRSVSALSCRAHGDSIATDSAFGIVVVASSLGGPQALSEMLSQFPADLSVPILVSQHLAPWSRLVENLRGSTSLRVVWSKDECHLQPGSVYVAPPERHMLIVGEWLASTRRGPRINYACPAADPLFETAAEHYGRRTLGVVLSGALFDGAAGARAIRRAGGTVLVQDPQSCRAPSMPREAIRRASCRLVLPPRSLAHAVIALVKVPGADALLGCGASVA